MLQRKEDGTEPEVWEQRLSMRQWVREWSRLRGREEELVGLGLQIDL